MTTSVDQKSQALQSAIANTMAQLGNVTTDTFAYTSIGKGVMVVKQKVGDFAVDYSRIHVHVDPDTTQTLVRPVNQLSQDELAAIALPFTTIPAEQAQAIVLAEDATTINQIAPHQASMPIVTTEVALKVIDGTGAYMMTSQTFPLAVISVRVQRSNGSVTYYLKPEDGSVIGWAIPTP